jgi:hypothetical protein
VSGYRVFRRDEMEFTPPSRGDQSRRLQRLSPALTTTRPNIWLMPPGSRGRRHRETVQEKLFVALEGDVVVPAGSVVVLAVDRVGPGLQGLAPGCSDGPDDHGDDGERRQGRDQRNRNHRREPGPAQRRR